MKETVDGVRHSRRQEERVEATRERILVSARKIFVRDGFDAARLEDIAADAGYTRGAFYGKFKDKEDLFVAVAEQQIAMHAKMALEAVRSRAGRQEKVEELMKRMGDMPEAAAWAVLLTEFSLFALRHPHQKKNVDSLHRNLTQGIEDVFTELYGKAKRKSKVPLSVLGVGYYSLIQGLALHSLLDCDLMTPATKEELLKNYLRDV
ncbi:MAG: TetR/AcrR family transcriptional regulator [Acidobacteriota bacterium]|nr:TetR/AcrR family transcriptional regulator [Acidobacteriota bacterium]